MLKCFWLGFPDVKQGKHSIKFETRKATALLAYLSLSPHGSSREILATMFWPEYDQSHALANLRRTLSSLVANLPPGTLEAERGIIRWKEPADRWVDVEEFQRAVKVNFHCTGELCEGCQKTLEQAANLYRGEFLEGLNLKDSPEFDAWQTYQRQEHQRINGSILAKLVDNHARGGQVEMALEYARRWVVMDRLNETAVRYMLRLLLQSGQHTEAKREYEEFSRLLMDHIGQAPDEETLALGKELEGSDAKHHKNMGSRSGQTESYPLLKTKLYIPTFPGRSVRRPHLINILNQIPKKPLTIISAPAGFGKTTLLAEWIAQTDLPIAWLSLDNGDNDVYRFLSYLITTSETIQEGVGIEARQIMQAPQLAPPHIILSSLLNDLGKLASPYVLVLDDYQFISEHAVHETISYLLDHLPANMHLVISTRADPSLQMGRLRAHGQMMELRIQDLRFTPEEASEFLNDVMLLELSVEDIGTLETRTEGWVVGLKLAALSLQGRADAREFIRNFSGSHRYVLDYLVEEVLSRQPFYIQEFLIQTSILEKLNASLCDFLMGEKWIQSYEGSQEILEYLERINLFLISLDDKRIWFRYHHLFTDLLRARLQTSLNAKGIAQLHISAADWHGQNGSTQEAIHHASLASDDQRVERFIEQNYKELVIRGEQAWLQSWISRLRKDLVYRRPWLCAYEAYSHAWFGELGQAEAFLDAAEKGIQSGNHNPDSDALMGLVLYVKCRITAMRGDLLRAIKLNLKARGYLPVSNLALQLDLGITLGYLYFMNGDYCRASQFLVETIHIGRVKGAILNTVAGYCILARLYADQGKLNQSYELYRDADQWIQESEEQHLGASGLIEIGYAEILCERNDLKAALGHVKKGLSLLPLWGKADDLVLAHITMARIELAQSNRHGAMETMEKALEVIRRTGVFPEATRALELAQVKLWLSQGDMPAANCWADSYEKFMSSDEQFGVGNELTRIALARVWIAQNKSDKALNILSRLEESAQSGGRTGLLIEILIFEALAMQVAEDTEHADVALTKSLTLAEPEGYMRVFLDEGKPLLTLLKRLRTSKLAPQLKDYVNRLLEASTSDAELSTILRERDSS